MTVAKGLSLKSWREILILAPIMFLSFTSRLPFLTKELPPFQFCDEQFFSLDVSQMLDSQFPAAREFRSGNLNSLPVYLVAFLAKLLGTSLTIENIIIE